MRRALANLVQNGINAVGRTARQGKIEIVLKGLAGSLMITVSDNGCGIPVDVGTNVFAPYYSQTQGGTGLGLSIVEKIIVDHGGKIWFESGDEGTVFYLCVPDGGLTESGA
jgi:signal transduction histidine kinase